MSTAQLPTAAAPIEDRYVRDCLRRIAVRATSIVDPMADADNTAVARALLDREQLKGQVAAALALHREHLTATPSRPDGAPYRCECVGCQMARVLLGEGK